MPDEKRDVGPHAELLERLQGLRNEIKNLQREFRAAAVPRKGRRAQTATAADRAKARKKR